MKKLNELETLFKSHCYVVQRTDEDVRVLDQGIINIYTIQFSMCVGGLIIVKCDLGCIKHLINSRDKDLLAFCCLKTNSIIYPFSLTVKKRSNKSEISFNNCNLVLFSRFPSILDDDSILSYLEEMTVAIRIIEEDIFRFIKQEFSVGAFRVKEFFESFDQKLGNEIDNLVTFETLESRLIPQIHKKIALFKKAGSEKVFKEIEHKRRILKRLRAQQKRLFTEYANI